MTAIHLSNAQLAVMTFTELRQAVEARMQLDDDGRAISPLICPLDGRRLGLTRRTILGSSARLLIEMASYLVNPNDANKWGWYPHFGKSAYVDCVHVNDFLRTHPSRRLVRVMSSGGEFARMQFWGLIYKRSGPKDDGNPNSGFWRMTAKGWRWVLNESRVWRYVWEFNDQVYFRSDGSNTAPREKLTLKQALKQKFNYDELLGSFKLSNAQKSALCG